jgi:hypothetical protein
MSLEGAPDRSYDVPPADERKGKTKAESDRHLGNPTVTHRSTMIRYPAGAMTPPGQKNVVGMKYWRRRNRPCASADRSESATGSEYPLTQGGQAGKR